MNNSEPRPADIIFPGAGRLHAIAEKFCVKPPFGCGKKLEKEPFHSNFEDLLSLKEYNISGLCQECQNEIFAELPEDDAPEKLGEQ